MRLRQDAPAIDRIKGRSDDMLIINGVTCSRFRSSALS